MNSDKYTNKKKILFIYPGSVYGVEDEIFKKKYHLLGRYFDGYIFIKSGGDASSAIDGFELFATSEKRRFASFLVLLKILKHTKRNDIDYIVCYDPLVSGLMGVFLKAYLRAKLIVEVNGVYTSEAVWFEYKNSVKAKIKKWIAPRIMEFVLKQADGIKLLFNGQIDSLGGQYKRNKIAVFHDFVPLSFFKNLDEKNEILFVGFPLYIKGVDILIESFKKIAHKHPDWKLKILGHYPHRAELDNFIDNHPQIYHHPPVLHRDIPDHIGRCAILVLPSRTEAMGRVLLEAAAAQKARISSNVDGIPTVVRHGVDGILVAPGDIDGLSRNLDDLISNRQLRERLSQAAFVRVYSQFSEDVYLEKYLAFLNEV
jgi:glycosyltransferase involved in cell wall biosynthesis